jgi:uncharacterized protein YfaS (alpha-2-macroglobulin family)
VELFSPQGLVKQARQATARFSRPMAPLGDLRGREPFEVSCAAPGKGRWVDDKNWAYDFDADLPGGLSCRFTLKPGLTTLDGAPVRGAREFRFTTGGPSITASRPYEGEWSRVAEDQAFVLTLDAPATPASIRAHARFAVDGLLESIPAVVLEGAAADRLVTAAHADASRPTAVIAAQRPFPADAVVRLIWGKGIATPDGVETQQDQTLAFKTRPPFKAELSCERTDKDSGCLPFAPVRLTFSSPVDWTLARGALLRSASGKTWAPEKPKRGSFGEGDEEGGAEEEPGGDGRWISSLAFQGPFPAEAELSLSLPVLVDDAGRALSNAGRFPLSFRTGPYPPLARFPADFGILELHAAPVLPVTLRNLEPSVRARLLKVGGKPAAGALDSLRARLFRAPADPGEVLRRLDLVLSHERERPALEGGSEIAVPKPYGAQAFEVVGIPLKKPGFYVVELESLKLGEALLGRSAPMFVPAAALVTNLGVHLKWGRESSVVWVTALDTGRPVPEASVTVADCDGRALWTGKTGPDGLARAVIPDEDSLPRCDYGRANRWAPWRLAVFARLGDDMSFVLDTWSEGIEPWRFQLPYEYGGAPVTTARTVLDRSLVRAGETVHMKHFLRRRTSEGFAVPAGKRPEKALIVHEGSGQRWELPLSWSQDGAATSEWAVPKEAKLGTYQVVLPADPARDWWNDSELAASFRVEEFRLPVLTAQLETPSAPLIAASSVPVRVAVRYLSGGGAAALPVRLRAQLEPKGSVSFPGFEDFAFGTGPVPPEERRRRAEPVEPIHASDLVLDGAGSAQTTVEISPSTAAPSDLALELEYRDPDGETQTVSSRAPLWPARRLVGLQVDSWAHAKGRLKFRAAVAGLDGAPAAGVPVSVSLVERRYRSFRKRLVGGFYAYEHSERLVRRGELCRGVTDARGLLLCDAATTASGGVVLEARARDQDGRLIMAHADAWIAGSDDWWFDVSDSDRMDLLPEKPRYEPGQVAPLQARMPFREATALVTVEREGVLDASVRRLSGKNPVVRVPIKGSYAPNVFVSVLAVRGRAGSPQPTALVDLARPAFRLGLAELKVGWRAHQLKVAVTPGKPAYKVRQKARVSVAATLPDGAPPPPGSEAAVAVVDEALLELMPNQTWDLLDAMMGRRGLSVRSFTAQLHVVGKRHFGLKALPQGGGGGRLTTRELFDTLLYWNPRVPLDARGRAVVEVPLNDSVSSFRAAAVVTAGAQRFGTGTARFRATQDLALHAGLPPLAREGDRYDALLTVRNATDRPMEVVARATASADAGVMPPLEPRSFRLDAGRSVELAWPVEVPAGASKLSFEASAVETGGERDAVLVTQRVAPSVPVRVLQATLAAVEGALTLDAARPSDALPGRGGLRVFLSPSLAGDMEGLLAYMRAYPYACMEQRASKAVALRDAALWSDNMEALPSYLDGDGLVKYFPTMEHGSDALTAYMISIADEAGWTIPEPARARMAGALKGFIEGRIVRGSALPTADLSYRKLAAAEALSRLGPLPEGLLSSIPPQPQLWPTSAVLDWRSIHARASGEQAARRVAEADRILRARLNLQGTTMGFSTEGTDRLWWLMLSGDVNAVRLTLAVLEDPVWKPDAPRLLRGALGRQSRGHWDLTVANAWGRLMLEKFARLYEAGPVAGRTTAALGEGRAALDWSDAPGGGALMLPWPEKPARLSVAHDGRGRPWAAVQSLAAVPLTQPLSSGYAIERTVTPVTQRTPGLWSRGDVARVRLAVSAQADMGWVVVDDPVPAGAAVLGAGLGRDSRMATEGENEKQDGWAWPAFQERSFEAFRSYYEFVPKGRFSVEYTVRFNNAGRFSLPPTRVEAMYSPEMFGELPNAELEVRP